MTVVVDDVLLREPNLLTPGSKPVGPVKVGWTHPAAKNLYTGLLFTGDGKDLGLGNNDVSLVGANAAYKTNKKGRIVTSTVAGTDSYALATFLNQSLTESITVSFGFVYKGDNNTGILSLADAPKSAGPYLLVQSRTGDIRIYFNGGFRLTFSSPVSGTYYNFTVKFTDSTDILSLWVDGVEIQTYSTTKGRNGLANLYINSGYNGNSTCDFSYCYINRIHALSDSQIISLHADPYQFLIPA